MGSKLAILYHRYERRLSSAALVLGFIVDNLTLKRIDLLFENLVLAFYLGVAGLGIALMNLYEGGFLRGRFGKRLHSFLPLLIQFAFGALFSGFSIFYLRSGSLAASWPFLLLIFGLLLGNEFSRQRYLRLGFQMGIFFIALFSYAIFYVPIVLGRMGAAVFLLSGVVSLVLMTAFLYVLSRFIPQRIRGGKTVLLRSIGGIFIVINLMYFTNLIPPIPLSLKEAGAYHSVSRTDEGDYLVSFEGRKWYEFLRLRGTLRLSSGEPVYVYSAVFAPTALNTQIIHHWQYYDKEKEKWISADRVQFAIVGGRDGGYRGYSLKTFLFPGLWRVNIETGRGQIIGRVKFEIEFAEEAPPLRTKILR